MFHFNLVVLYLRKRQTDGIYSCNKHFWIVQGDNVSSTELITSNHTSNKFPSIDETFSSKWLKQFKLFVHFVFRNNELLFSLTINCFFFLLVWTLSSKVEMASLVYSKIAFIMEYGYKVRTLNKLRNKFINNQLFKK